MKNLLGKIRATYDLQKKFVQKNEIYLKYNSSKVLSLDTTESDSGSEDKLDEENMSEISNQNNHD